MNKPLAYFESKTETEMFYFCGFCAHQYAGRGKVLAAICLNEKPYGKLKKKLKHLQQFPFPRSVVCSVRCHLSGHGHMVAGLGWGRVWRERGWGAVAHLNKIASGALKRSALCLKLAQAQKKQKQPKCSTIAYANVAISAERVCVCVCVLVFVCVCACLCVFVCVPHVLACFAAYENEHDMLI